MPICGPRCFFFFWRQCPESALSPVAVWHELDCVEADLLEGNFPQEKEESDANTQKAASEAQDLAARLEAAEARYSGAQQELSAARQHAVELQAAAEDGGTEKAALQAELSAVKADFERERGVAQTADSVQKVRRFPGALGCGSEFRFRSADPSGFLLPIPCPI